MGEAFVVLFLAGIEAQILQKRDLSLAEIADHLAHAIADWLIGEDDLAIEELGHVSGHRLER